MNKHIIRVVEVQETNVSQVNVGRHNPDKPQNNYGGDYECKNYDKVNGIEFCHDEGQANWDCFIKWWKTEDEKLICKGNRHNCKKMYYKWLASINGEEK